VRIIRRLSDADAVRVDLLHRAYAEYYNRWMT